MELKKTSEDKKTDEIKEYIKHEHNFTIPAIQEKFSLTYYTVREIIRKLENDDEVRLVSGICYEYIGDKGDAEEDYDTSDDSDDSDDSEGSESKKRNGPDILKELRNLGYYLDTDDCRRVVRTAAAEISESDHHVISPYRYSRPDDPKEDYNVCTYEETLAGRQNASDNDEDEDEEDAEDKDSKTENDQEDEEYVIYDTDDEEYFGWSVQRRYGYEFTKMALEYMEKMPGFDPDTKTFRPRLNVRFPDGSPLYICYNVNANNDTNNNKFYFTDTGCVWKYFSGCYPGVETSKLEKCFYRIAGKLGFNGKFFFVKDRILYSNLAYVGGIEDFTDELAYMFERIEEFLAAFERPELLNGIETQASLEDKISRFVEDDANYDVDLDIGNEYTLGAATVELLQRIASIDKSITREKALEIAVKMYTRTENELLSFEVRMLLRNIMKALEEYDDSQFEAICKIRIPR